MLESSPDYCLTPIRIRESRSQSDSCEATGLSLDLYTPGSLLSVCADSRVPAVVKGRMRNCCEGEDKRRSGGERYVR